MLDVLQYQFMQNALLAGLLAAIACGIVGVYVVVKKVVFISGGIAHASFGGIGLGYLMGVNPVLGAMVFTVASSLGIGLITRRTKLPEDTAIGILWAMGMALGIIFIGLAPNILTVPFFDLMLMLILDVVIIVLVALLYKGFLYLSFDEEFSTVSGVPTYRRRWPDSSPTT